MPIAPALQRFVDEELARAPALIERVAAGTLQLLREVKDNSLSGAERGQESALREALQRGRAAYEGRFVQGLRQGVFEVLAEQFEGLPSQGLDSEDGLQLMDESRVEIDIAISRAMQLIDSTAEWELRELQTFTSTLIGQSHVSAESNPFRPLVYATALWHAAGEICGSTAQQATLLRVSAGVIAGLLKSAWSTACARFESQGIEPSVYRTVVLVPGNSVGRSPVRSDANASSTLSNLLASMPAGSPDLQLHVGRSALPAAPGNASRRSGAVSGGRSAEFEQALLRLDELLRHLPAVNTGPGDFMDTLAKRLGPHRAALAASAAAPIERQVIELVSRLFDAMLADPLLPGAVQATLARLQASALRVALHDTDMVQSSNHAVWRLLDRISEAGAAYPLANDPRGSALAAFAQGLAVQLAQARQPDATLYLRALTQFDHFLDEQLASQVRAAQPVIEALSRSERRDMLERVLAQRLVDQTQSTRIDASVRRFVTQTWARVLAEAMLQFGEDGADTRAYVKLVDELLWSVQLPDHPKSRQRLIALLPGLLQRLRSGMELIGVPGTEQDRVLDEFMAIHADALRPGRSESAHLSPEQLVQRMRDEVLPASTGHGAFSDSVIDLASMQTVPAELIPNDRPDAADAVRRVEALRESSRLRLFLNGRWCRVQLLWRSEQRQFYLFAGENPARTHSVTHRALERLNSVGLMQPLEAKTTVQRALDKVTHDLLQLA